MKSDRDIEAWVRTTDPDTQPSMDKQVLQRMLEAQQAGVQSRNTGSWFLSGGIGFRVVKVAAVLLVVLGIGFGGGRLSTPSTEAVKISLEQEIRDTVRQEMAQQMASYRHEQADWLQKEMVLLMCQTLGESMTQTRVACQAYTEQRLRALVQLIDKTRSEDRKYVATALELLESHRQQDTNLLKRGIVALTLHRQDQPEHTIQ